LNSDLIFALAFYGLLFIFFLVKRDKFEVQGGIFALYRTKLGLKLMDRLSGRFLLMWDIIGVLAIIIGFFGMALMIYFLMIGAYGVLLGKEAILSPVIPGVKIAAGLPTLGFWHWVISIFIVAVIHEFSHGVLARRYDVKVKSSGFAFLGPILAAFVEPDEKQLKKRKKREQLAVFSAGPFSNIVLGIVFLIITAFLANASYNTMDFNGMKINGFEKDSVLEQTGVQIGEIIYSVNGIKIEDRGSFDKVAKSMKPGDKVSIVTDKGTYNVYAGQYLGNKERAYLGVSLEAKGFKQDYKDRYGDFWLRALYWFYLLCWWIYTISIGIGIFNLVPLGPVDGGRMLLTGLQRFFKDKTAKRVWLYVSWFVLLLIFVNLLPWIIKLLMFIVNLFS